MEAFLLYSVIAFALAFDFVNGFHDAANSIATVVATRVLKPFQAVLWAATFNFLAFLFFGTKVANTIAKGVVDQKVLSIGMIFAGLVGAIFWNILTAYLGLPSSSSHALVGGMVGAGVAKAGGHVVLIEGLKKIGVFIVFSPLVGLVLAFTLFILVSWAIHRIRHPEKTNKAFRGMQLASAAMFSLGHGANDAQKTMGLILALLIASGRLGKDATIPTHWVLAAHAAIGLGTMFGGWKIVKTMGTKLTKLEPMGGVCAETAAASVLFFVSSKGIPVSTTHTITGSIVGVGSARRLSAVRWNIASRVLWAWLLTIPGAAIVAAIMYKIVEAFS
jgi:inorganic phosphate transporter, PiT family